MAKILVVDDDVNLCQNICSSLEKDLHQVEAVNSAADACDRLKFYTYDLVILDWSLPDGSGVTVCREYRSQGGATPILMLTGKSELRDKEEGLDSGADDYLTKPFALRELAARARALLRRPQAMVQDELCLGSLRMERHNRRLFVGGKEIELLPKEFALLEFFMLHPNQVFSIDSLIDRVWPSTSDTSPEILRVYVTRLRKKLDLGNENSDKSERQVFIRTVHGAGYKFEVPTK